MESVGGLSGVYGGDPPSGGTSISTEVVSLGRTPRDPSSKGPLSPET